MLTYKHKMQLLPNVTTFMDCELTRDVGKYPTGTHFDIIAISASGQAFLGNTATGETDVVDLVELGIAEEMTEDEIKNLIARMILREIVGEIDDSIMGDRRHDNN